MGGSPSKKMKLYRSSDKEVQGLLELAREEATNGNIDQSQKLYESAVAKAPSTKEQDVIRKEMSSTDVTKVVDEGCFKRALKRQSTTKTKNHSTPSSTK